MMIALGVMFIAVAVVAAAGIVAVFKNILSKRPGDRASCRGGARCLMMTAIAANPKEQ